MPMELSVLRLREVLDYSPNTGMFTWRQRLNRRCPIGKLAGSISSAGYIRIKIDHEQYLAHRLAWLWMTSSWPISEIDHIDLCRTNNRWNNLRQASASQNRWNTSKRSSNTSGFKGVFLDHRAKSKPWRALITYDGKLRWIGSYATKKEAATAYIGEAKRLHGEFWRTT